MREIDCTGLQCPIPVGKIKRYFDSIGEGDAIVYVDNEIANGNIIKYAMGQGYHVESNINLDGNYEIIIEKRGCLEILEEIKKIVIVITSDKLGEGNDKLGDSLMTSYFDSLSEEENLPTKIIFLNGGVKLICRGSKVIEGIHILQEKGVKIYASKKCLQTFNLSNELLIGKEIDMTRIVEIMNSADNVIKL